MLHLFKIEPFLTDAFGRKTVMVMALGEVDIVALSEDMGPCT